MATKLSLDMRMRIDLLSLVPKDCPRSLYPRSDEYMCLPTQRIELVLTYYNPFFILC